MQLRLLVKQQQAQCYPFQQNTTSLDAAFDAANTARSALFTWMIPASEYQRCTDAATVREVVVAGTYARVTAALVGLNAALLAVLLGATVDYGRWLRFAIPGALLVALVGASGVILAA